MEKIIILIILFNFSFHSINAQYDSIYKDSSTYFLLTIEGYDGAFPGIPLELFGDTILNNQIYRRTYLFDAMIGLFREDSTHSKAWFWGRNDKAERLIMDLNLMIGDTFNLEPNYFNCGESEYAIVESIDSINGRKRLTFNCSFGAGYISEPLQFIEGIGPNSALYFLISEDLDLAQLVCKKYENTELVFHYYPNEDDCILFMGTEKVEYVNSFIIYPNPFQNYILFEADLGLTEVEIELYSMEGSLILQRIFTSNDILETDHLANGIYFYRVKINDEITSGKLIKS